MTYNELIEQYETIIDECCPVVDIMGYKYVASRVLKEIDPIVYWEDFSGFLNGLFLEGVITQQQLDNGGHI